MFTLAIHAFGIVMIALALVWVDPFAGAQPSTMKMVTISTALIGALGLMLALLHGLEAAIWAGTYLWLGALPSLHDAMRPAHHSRQVRAHAGKPLEAVWRIGSGRWHALIWHQHSIPVCGDARSLAAVQSIAKRIKWKAVERRSATLEKSPGSPPWVKLRQTARH